MEVCEHMNEPTLDGCPVAEWLTRHDTDPAPADSRWPTLELIGLSYALDVVEAVAADSQGKHPGTKWLTKSVAHHDAKGIKHLGHAQCGETLDHESGLPARSHATLRLLMALGLELRGDYGAAQ